MQQSISNTMQHVGSSMRGQRLTALSSRVSSRFGKIKESLFDEHNNKDGTAATQTLDEEESDEFFMQGGLIAFDEEGDMRADFRNSHGQNRYQMSEPCLDVSGLDQGKEGSASGSQHSSSHNHDGDNDDDSSSGSSDVYTDESSDDDGNNNGDAGAAAAASPAEKELASYKRPKTKTKKKRKKKPPQGADNGGKDHHHHRHHSKERKKKEETTSGRPKLKPYSQKAADQLWQQQEREDFLKQLESKVGPASDDLPHDIVHANQSMEDDDDDAMSAITSSSKKKKKKKKHGHHNHDDDHDGDDDKSIKSSKSHHSKRSSSRHRSKSKDDNDGGDDNKSIKSAQSHPPHSRGRQRSKHHDHDDDDDDKSVKSTKSHHRRSSSHHRTKESSSSSKDGKSPDEKKKKKKDDDDLKSLQSHKSSDSHQTHNSKHHRAHSTSRHRRHHTNKPSTIHEHEGEDEQHMDKASRRRIWKAQQKYAKELSKKKLNISNFTERQPLHPWEMTSGELSDVPHHSENNDDDGNSSYDELKPAWAEELHFKEEQTDSDEETTMKNLGLRTRQQQAKATWHEAQIAALLITNNHGGSNRSDEPEVIDEHAAGIDDDDDDDGSVRSHVKSLKSRSRRAQQSLAKLSSFGSESESQSYSYSFDVRDTSNHDTSNDATSYSREAMTSSSSVWDPDHQQQQEPSTPATTATTPQHTQETLTSLSNLAWDRVVPMPRSSSASTLSTYNLQQEQAQLMHRTLEPHLAQIRRANKDLKHQVLQIVTAMTRYKLRHPDEVVGVAMEPLNSTTAAADNEYARMEAERVRLLTAIDNLQLLEIDMRTVLEDISLMMTEHNNNYTNNKS